MRLVQFTLSSAAALMAATTLAAADPLDGAQRSSVGDFQTLSAASATPLTAQESAAARGSDYIENVEAGYKQEIPNDVLLAALRLGFSCTTEVDASCYLPMDVTAGPVQLQVVTLSTIELKP